MGKHRDRMAQDLALRGLAKRTHEGYLHYARMFVAHFGRSADQLGIEDVRAWILWLLSPIRTALFDKRWVVYAKQPFGGAEQVFSYLGRYTHRVGISNARILRSDASTVTFATKNGGTCSLSHVEFLRRLLQHVLPKGFHKIRHYGLASASRIRLGSLDRACLLLAPNAKCVTRASRALAGAPQTWLECLLALTGLDAMRCPRCNAPSMNRHPLGAGGPPALHDTS